MNRRRNRRLPVSSGGRILLAAVVGAASLALAKSSPTVPRLAPPGAPSPDPGPSPVIFPAQKIPLRFNHANHITRGATCTSCHTRAESSQSSQDRLLPPPLACDSCHGTNHANLGQVVGGPTPIGQCGFCHEGYTPEHANAVAKVEIPSPNLVFNHAKHASRNIGCAACHGAVEQVGLATRDQLPRMLGCMRCHGMPDSPSRGQANGTCDTCHVRVEGTLAGPDRKTFLPPTASHPSGQGGAIQTVFKSGVLRPPAWLHGAEHTPDFLETHKYSAGNDSLFCKNCHGEDFCTSCHDGRVRPRDVHPNDYLHLHAVEAQMASTRCASCHREQSFCLPCHQRLGIALTSPASVRSSGRFHPPKEVWSDPPMRTGHHGQEAIRNMNTCVSCHTERDCATCHGAQGIGGGFSPHRGDFASTCSSAWRQNPRPCLGCHRPDDPALSLCL